MGGYFTTLIFFLTIAGVFRAAFIFAGFSRQCCSPLWNLSGKTPQRWLLSAARVAIFKREGARGREKHGICTFLSGTGLQRLYTGYHSRGGEHARSSSSHEGACLSHLHVHQISHTAPITKRQRLGVCNSAGTGELLGGVLPKSGNGWIHLELLLTYVVLSQYTQKFGHFHSAWK